MLLRQSIRSLFFSLLAALSLSVLTPMAAADGTDFKQAVNAYQNKNYEYAFAQFQKLAKLGDIPAQYNLGQMYRLGQGVKRDDRQAFKWYQKSAERGYVDAQFNLGYMYWQGQGVKRDYAQAAKWFQKAAEQNDVSAQYNLGEMYLQGKGVKQNKRTAKQYFEAACKNGLLTGCEAHRRLSE